MISKLSRLAPAGIVFLLVFAVFSPSLGGGFLAWDDPGTLLKTTGWRGLAPVNLRWMVWSLQMGPWQPLAWLTFAIDHAIWGLTPFGYRFTGLVLHSLAAALCVPLFEALGAAAAPHGTPSARRVAAAIGALAFGIHPLRTESVCWVTERRDVLCGLFYILGLWLYARRRRGDGMIPPFLAFIAACLAKGSAISFPVALLILDVWPLRRRALAEKIPFFVAAVIIGFIGLLGQSWAGALLPVQQSGIGERWALAIYGLFFYAEKSVLPLWLSPAYPIPPGFGPLSPRTLAAMIVVVAAGWWAWRRRRQAPALAAALLYSAVAAAPVLGAVRFGAQLAADRYSYLPGLGWGGLAAAAYFSAPRGRWTNIVAAMVLAVLAATSASLATVWRSDLALWSRAVALYPDSQTANINLSTALRNAGRVDEAADCERRALAVDPLNAALHNNYGSWLLDQGHAAAALPHLSRAAALSPYSAEIHNNLGSVLAAQGRPQEATAEFLRALSLRGDYPEARNNLALAQMALGRPDAAERELRTAIAAKPAWAPARFNHADALAALGRDAEAQTEYAAAVRLDPGLTAAVSINVGNLFARRGRFADAEKRYRQALAAAPGNAAAAANLAKVRQILTGR